VQLKISSIPICLLQIVNLPDIKTPSMKNRISTIILTLSVNFIIAQSAVKLTVSEENKSMSKGSANAFVMEVPQTKAADLKKDWQKFLKDNSRAKIEDDKTELSAIGANISKLSTSLLNHYALFTENTNASKIFTFFQINDAFVSTATNAEVAANVKLFMLEFGKLTYSNVVENEIKEEQKKLKTLEKELESLMKGEDKAKGKIINFKHNIEQDELEIKAKKHEQEVMQKEIEAQKEKMIGISLHKEEQKLQKKLISRMDSDKKKIIKAQSNLLKDIHKNESKIRETESEIVKIKEKQTAKTTEVDKQKYLLQQVQNKLEAIKKF
jgi:hypothetical protein